MAVQDCDKISNIVAIQLLAGNDDLAKEIAELAATKNYTQTTIAKLGEGGKDLAGRSVNSLELMAKSAEIKIDAIVQSHILKGQAGEEALMEVARQMSKTKDSLYGGVKLLEMIRGGSDVDIKEVARLWDDTLNTSEAMEQMENAIADYIASDYSIYRAYNAIEDALSDASKKIKDAKQSTKDAKVRLDKGIITDKEFRKIKKENDLTIKTLTKEKEDIKDALKKDYKLAIDKIKEGGNPTGFSKLDSEWAAIKKVFGNEPEKAGRLWTNYIMARELLAGGEMADEVLSVLAKEGENLAGDLTEEWIVKCTNLDTLIARAFTNTEQLCNNGMLRELYRDKLIQLSAGIRLTEENADKVKTLINTSLFAEEGMTLSDVMLDNRAYRSMKGLGYKVTERDGERILNDLQNIAEKFSEDIFGEEDIVIKIAGQEVKPQDAVQLIYNITGDENIIKLLNSRNFSDTSVLSIATQKLLGNNDLARQGIINLFKKGKEGSKITNVRGVFFRALTGMEIPDGAKVGYFDYRRALYTKDELSDSKARLYDLIADKNKLRVEGDIAGDFTKDWQYSQENVEKLANEIKTNLKGGFLVVNDARWGDNQLLREAVDKLRKEGDLTILYPKGGQMSSFIREGDNLFFKTIDDSVYDNVAGTISIQSLGEAKPTREILASAYEAATGRNGDKLRYQASYNDGGVDSLGRQISDQQVEYFANSVVRDENGNLIRMYHGRSKQFDVFDIEYARKEGDIQGFFLSEYRETSEEYGPDIIECYLNITNPAPRIEAYEVFGSFEGQNNRGVLAKEELQRRGYDGVQSDSGEWIAFSPEQIKYVDNRVPTTDPNMHFMRRTNQYTDQPDMPITDALKVQMFTKDRTWEQIATDYGFSIEYAHGTDMIQGVKAYGAYGNGVIYFTDMVKESTPPHELFHGIFNMYVRGQDPDMYERVLRESSELFGVSEYKAEEILADSFAEWFRTGEFTYGEKLKKEAEEMLSKEGKIKKKGLNKEQKSLVAQVLEYFKEIARQLGILDNHRAEVKQMFEDMVNMKYLPDDGKPVDPETALAKYNKELNDAAVNYFGKMLGLDSTDPLYVRNVETKLSEMLGIDIQTFDSFTDKASLYRRIDKQLALERLTTGNFDRDIVNIGNVRKEINALSEDDLEKQIKDKLGVLVNGGPIKGNENIELIREAWFNYNTAEDMSQLLSAEGKIISLVNGVQPASLSLEDLKTLFKDKDALKRRYKEMFFPEQEVTDKELDMFVRQINGDVYDSLSIQFVENLVKEGYDLPLINAKTAMYDYLNGKLDLNSDFARAFMYKNNIAMTSDNLNAIVEGTLPREFSFDFTTFENKLADESLQGDVSRVIKRENQFLPDTYTALSAIEGARAGESLGGAEYQVLKGTIDKYVKAMKEGVRNSKFTFKDAQKLKQDFSYAMDTFEQEIILPKYSKFLTPEERQSLLGIKYSAPIAVGGQNAREVEKMLDNWANRILGREEVGPNGERIIHKGSYQNTMSQLASDNDINVAIAKGYNANDLDEATINRIERRRNQLISNGSTIKEINGEYVVYDVKETLWQTLNNMPSSIEGYAGILALGREGIENLTNKQAYVLLRYLEAAKALATTSNYTTQLMYKQTPLLAQYSFFTTYAVDANTGLPRVMGNNSLASDNFFTDILASNTIDQDIKNDIFSDIIKGFRKNKYVGEDELDEMIDKAISRQIDELGKLNTFSPQEIETARGKMKNIYTNMFIPYSYLRDLPVEGGIKEKLESTMKEAYNQAIKDLKAAGASDTDDIQKMIMIRMDDGSSKNLSDLANVKIDDWKKTIFNDESILVRGADEVNVDEKFNRRFWEDSDDVERRLTKEQKRLRENIQNQYTATLKAIENQSQIISDSERKLMVSFMSDVRTDLRKYSLTNKMVDALDAVSGMGEEVARGMKNYIIGLRGMWTYGKFRAADIWARYDKVREAYRSFYNMPLESLMKAKPRNAAEEVAWNAARYFKNLERMLGSVDGKTGVTTSEAVNKAFYHIGETFMNLGANGASETSGIRGLFGMLSGIEQNQVLKFFKFSNPGQPSYVKMFKQAHRRDERLLEGVGGYRDYVETINNIDRETFNRLFGTNYSDGVFKRVLQGLTGFTLAGGGFARRINKLLDVANSSRLAFRMLMSYPGQLLTIPQQGVAYFLKQIGYEQALGIEDMGRIDAIRESFGILDGAYNELNITRKLGFNPDSLDKNAFYNRYGIPTMKDLYEDTGITTADDYINMYAKVDKKYSKPGKMSSWIKWLDPYKDNANNFIDGIFARNFKNIAFVKGLRDNSYMKFASAEDFLEFMNDATVSAEVKSRLMDAVASSSGRNFRNILGLGFGGLDRPIGGAGWQNILYGLMQLFNFRGSWGQNIFKQTGENFWRLYKATLGMPGLSREAREKLVDYLGNTPEFVNFVTAMLHDLEWSFKLTRYQDNGRWPDENEDPWYYFLDYLSYVGETMNMVSQWYQGIQSFGPLRPFIERRDSMLMSQMDPTIYHDTWGVGALFNALGKNFGRQRKPVNRLTELAGAYESGGLPNMKAYFEKQFFNLSFGSLRYMVNEDENSYGYTYEVSGQVGGIPSIAMGEAQIGSDKSFMYALDNSETWKAMQLIADDDVAWADKKKYRGNLGKAFVNGSQLFKTIKNFNKVRKGEYNKSFFSSEDLAGIIQQTKAGKEFYDKGYVIPSTNEEAVTFIKTILNHSEYRPGSRQFNKSLLQFEDFGHMDAAKGNAADAQMELWLEHMKYETNEHGEFVKKKGERVVDENWNKLITNVKKYYSNEEYVANVIYNYSKDWLDEHSKDPNYPLYLKMLGQGNANMLIDSELNKIKAIRNKGVKGDLKWTDANLNAAEYRDMILRMGNSILDGDNITFFEKLNRLDEDDATLAALKIIYDQSTDLGRTDIEKFFDIETSKEDDTIVEDVKLKSQYESVLTQIGQIGRAIDEGNEERVIATMSSLTHQFKNDDPTGEITAMVIDSTYDRINDAKNLSPAMKNEMMIGLFYDNKDFIQRNPEKLRELLGDAYDEYARKTNEMLYKRDGQIISNMEELVSRNEDNIKAISGALKKGSGASKAIKGAAMNLSGISGSGIGNGRYRTGQRAGQGYGEWVPVKIKGADLVKELGLKGYNPTNVEEIVFKYTPHTDLSLAKDINRTVKGPKTESVSTKKQLSNLEEKATKALEAES